MANVSPNLAYNPQDVNIQSIRIFPAGNFLGVDVSKLLVELSYFEDIYSFAVSGYILLKDGVGIIEKMQLSGKETIRIIFGKTKDGPSNIDKEFRIYSIPDRKPVGNQTTEYIKLYFCSQELFSSEESKVTKSYNGKSVHDIVYDIVSNEMKIRPEKISRLNFERTNGVYNFVIPTLKPFEAISWLCTYAKPLGTGVTGADMLFYETRDGFEFRSLSSIYKNVPYKTYRYDIKNIDVQTDDQKMTSVLDYQFIKDFDSLNEINSGTFINRVIAIDPLSRSVNTTDFKYDDYKGTRLNRGDPTDVSEYRNPKAFIKLVTSNSNQKVKPTFDIFRGNLVPDVFIPETVRNRTAQLALANYTVLKIRVPGDTGLKVGSVINFEVLPLDFSKEKRATNKFYSGKYLVTAVRHIVQSPGVFQTILEITKDSSQAKYEDYR